jgi:hypothetical protein
MGTRQEFRAAQNVHQFYNEVWKPWAQCRGFATDGNWWHANDPATYEQWMERFTDHNKSPYKEYNDYYDREIAPHLRH